MNLSDCQDQHVVAQFLVRGGPVAANVSTEHARMCLNAVNSASSSLRDRFNDLVFMNPTTGDFDPFAKLWVPGDRNFLFIPRNEDYFSKSITTERIVAQHPCFTIYSSQSKPNHLIGQEVYIGYEEKDVEIEGRSSKQWHRVVYLRNVDDHYTNVGWPRNTKTLKQSSQGFTTMSLEQLLDFCPQAVADVHRAFRKAETKEQSTGGTSSHPSSILHEE